MKKYKVEFNQIQTYVIDILADNEQEATSLAEKKLEELTNSGLLHYKEEGDLETEVVDIYDVTNTDDPFNPEN